MQSKNKDKLRAESAINEIIFRKLHDMHNGSITIIKQDNTIIQINIKNRFYLYEQTDEGVFMEGGIS